MKRLYAILDTTTGHEVPGLYFEDQRSAKEKRREKNRAAPGYAEVLRFVVTPGPDHVKRTGTRA